MGLPHPFSESHSPYLKISQKGINKRKEEEFKKIQRRKAHRS